MAKLTRKLWVGIGAAATIAGAPMTVPMTRSALAQEPAHKGHAPPPIDAKASDTAAPGGEAYLADGGPRDTRIRFYRDIELMRGHINIGGELIALGLWDEALPHFLHPTEELYGVMEKYIKLHRILPFRRELQALAQTVKAKREGAYRQSLKIVNGRLDTALGVAKKFMTPPHRFTVQSAVEVLRVAQSEYATSIENGRFVKPVEYQDSRGFVWQAERMIEGAAPKLATLDKEALQKVRADVARLKKAWPAPMPPDAPVLEPGQISAIISDIELHVSRY
jgi:hypothetical protein